jgi:hypothetical protein
MFSNFENFSIPLLVALAYPILRFVLQKRQCDQAVEDLALQK